MRWASLLLLLIAIAGCRVKMNSVDATSMRGKVLCGYQGWIHWSGNSKEIRPDTLTFEMWPDMSEYSDKERYEAMLNELLAATGPSDGQPPDGQASDGQPPEGPAPEASGPTIEELD